MDKKLISEEEQEKIDKKQLAKEYCEMIEAKLRKAERRTWMIKDLDHIKR